MLFRSGRCFGPRVDASKIATELLALPKRNPAADSRLVQLKSLSSDSFLKMLKALEA